MEPEKKELRQDGLWQGGLWEQKNPEYPKTPEVVIPPVRLAKPTVEKIPRKKGNISAKLSFVGLLALILSLVALVVVIGDGGVTLELPLIPDIFLEEGTSEVVETSNKPPTIAAASTNSTIRLDFTAVPKKVLTSQEVYDKCLPSVVFIEASSYKQSATGTGVILSEEGYIITNAHVIGSASEANVTLYNNERYDATLVGYNFEQDLAVLKINAENLVPAEFADSDGLKVGDVSYAMGNPLGAKYRSTFTDGMISAVDRVLEVDGTSVIFVQTTAAINSGNSGGALINQYGQVVGITTIKIMSEDDTIEGMGFAIPSKRVKQVIDRLLAGEDVIRPTIGIRVLPTTEPVQGLEVISVEEGSEVDKAGLSSGDIILEANGRSIYWAADLELVKGYLFVGDFIEYLVYRDGKELSIRAELEDRS